MNNIFKKPWFLIITASVIVSFFLLLMGGVDMSIDLSRNNENKEDIVDDSSAVVMIVNGIEFNYSEFKSMMDQVEWEFSMEERELVEEEVKEAVIERIIQQAVLIGYAREENLTPSTEEIEERFNEILESYEMSEEDFLELVKGEHGISTRKEIEELLEGEIMVSRLFDRYVERVVVLEEEVINAYKEFIGELKASGTEEGDSPEMAEMRSFLEDNIKYEKASEEILEKAGQLKESASIEIFLDNFDF